MSDCNDIEAAAANWVAREDAGLSFAERASLDAWIAQSTAHRVAYLRLKAVWNSADRLAVLRGSRRPQDRGARSNWRSLAAAVLAVVAVGLAGAVWTLYPRETFETPVGVRETVHLADGSLIELNTDTALRTHLDGGKRQVFLDRGEAYFEVVHDARRPFVVIAADKRITDLGTKFSVKVDGDKVDVLVTEGRVRLDDVGGRKKALPVVAVQDTQVLTAADNTLITSRSARDVRDALGWREGLLIFHQETLRDAAEEFNRYNQKKLVIADDTIAQTRIGGSFDATNVDAFARLLRDGFGFTIEDDQTAIKISQ